MSTFHFSPTRVQVAWIAILPLITSLVPWFTHAAQTEISQAELLSVTSDGSQSNSDTDALQPISISADGRYVAFGSLSSNLVPGDTNGIWDIFVRDRVASTTTRASIASNGAEANGTSIAPTISANGRYAAFLSQATNLVPDDFNGTLDVFIHDFLTGVTERLGAENGSGARSPSLSANGDIVAYVVLKPFGSADVIIYDRQTNSEKVLDFNAVDASPSVSADGSKIAFQSGGPSGIEIYVYNNTSDTVSSVSAPAGGGKSRPAISADGKYVVFQHNSSVPGDPVFSIYFSDIVNTTAELISSTYSGEKENGQSLSPSISTDGRYVVFSSSSSNLIQDDTNGRSDVFIRDRITAVTKRVSLALDGSELNEHSTVPMISSDGRYISFVSRASNIVPGDTNDKNDVFLVTNPLLTCGDELYAFCQQAESIINTITDTYDLGESIENSYLANLKKVSTFIDSGKVNAAVGQLDAFIEKVEDDYAAGVISQSVYEELIHSAQQLLDELS